MVAYASERVRETEKHTDRQNGHGTQVNGHVNNKSARHIMASQRPTTTMAWAACKAHQRACNIRCCIIAKTIRVFRNHISMLSAISLLRNMYLLFVLAGDLIE